MILPFYLNPGDLKQSHADSIVPCLNNSDTFINGNSGWTSQKQNSYYSQNVGPPLPKSLQFQNVTIPWSNSVKYLGLLLDSELLFTKHLQTVLHKAMGTFLKIFPLLARDSPLTIPNKILLYKLLLRSMITYAAPAWSSTTLTNYHHLQVYQSKFLLVVGDFPRRTPISHLHAHLQMIPVRQFIYDLTDKFFVRCPAHPNPLIRNTGNYTLKDLHRKYTK